MADRIILACTVLVAVVYLYATTLIPTLAIGDPLGPKAFPRLLGIALLIACGFLALEMWRGRHEEAEAEKEKAAGEPLFEGKVLAVLLVVVVWTGCYYLVFEDLGFVIATTLYLLPMMMWFNRRRWLANVASAALFSLFTYWLFVKLEVRLPQGLLPF